MHAKRAIHMHVREQQNRPKRSEVAPRGSENRPGQISALSACKRIVNVNPYITHQIFDLATTKKDLDGTTLAGGREGDGCIVR